MISYGLSKYIISVSNIPWTVGRHELSQYFSQFGCVVSSFVAFDKKTGFHQGTGNVIFLKKEDANNILKRQHSLEGNDLVIFRKK